MRYSILFLAIIIRSLSSHAQISFTVSSTQQFSLTCANTQIDLTATSNFSATVNYAWTGPGISSSGTLITVNNSGTYTVTATSGNFSTIQTVNVVSNTAPPVCLSSSTFQAISGTMTPQTFTFTSITPTVNIAHTTYNPHGMPPLVSAGIVALFTPYSFGTYTHCIVDLVNGCSTCIPFIYQEGVVFPGTGSSIEEIDMSKISVFPNPTNGLFKLNNLGADFTEIEIYTGIGDLVHKQQVSEQPVIDIGDKASGIYILTLIKNKKVVDFIKIVKE